MATSGFIENLDQCENGLVTSAQGANILISLRQARQWMGGDKRQHGSKATRIKSNRDKRHRGSKATGIKGNKNEMQLERHLNPGNWQQTATGNKGKDRNGQQNLKKQNSPWMEIWKMYFSSPAFSWAINW